jgi:transmembrane sensor
MKPQTNDAALFIREAAAEWITALEQGGTRERTECLAWLRESPEHVREFLLMAALWKDLDGVDAQRRIDIEGLLATASATVVPIEPNKSQQQGASRSIPTNWSTHHKKWWLAGIAATAAAVALVLGWAMPMLSGKQVYETAVGQQRTVTLTDGSLVQLNTRTRLEVQLGGKLRELHLLEGEALFTVAHDATRPFEVHVGDALVRAVGTQFNIRRDVRDTTVSVLEGTVLVSAIGTDDSQPHLPNDATHGTLNSGAQALSAGEQVRITARVGLDRLAQPNVQKAVAWRNRVLTFNGEPLVTIAAEINRYNDELQIEVEGKARERQLIGVFSADDPESLVQFLSQQDDIRVERSGAVVKILPRSE